MEPIGFAAGVIGLAGLFSVCLDVIDKVDSYKDYGVESRSIVALFKGYKYLFTKWAQDVGINNPKPDNNYHNQLDNPETKLRVQDILLSIQEIFSKTESTMSNLHPVVKAGPTSFPDGIYFHNTHKVSQNPKGAISKIGRIGWSLQGKAKLISDVGRFKEMIQLLQDLVPLEGLIGPIGNDLSLRNGMYLSKSIGG